MKITSKILSLPPFISTTWNNVKALQMKGTALAITLNDGDVVLIPGLAPEILDVIFKMHAAYLELETTQPARVNPTESPKAGTTQSQGALDEASLDFPLRFGIGSIENMGAILQHNPSQMNAPDIPPPILQKIGAIAKIVAPEDVLSLPKPEPHCNCMHCQIARTIHKNLSGEEATPTALAVEPDVSDEDLIFRQWDITQTGDKLFTVINRLDTQEKYSVYLGHPIGCTCGKNGCEHIVAVLKS